MKRTLHFPVLWMTIFFVFPGFVQSQNALDFDGSDDRVDCGNDTSVQIGGKAITLEAWIYPTVWKTNAYDGNVICKEYNTSNYGYMLRVGAGGRLNFGLGDGAWHEITTGTILSLNTWQHIAGTYDGKKMRVYLNGNPADSLVYTSDVVKNTISNLFIGAHLTYSRFYQGAIDEARIWSVCRTEDQLKAAMNSELCATETGLRAYYKFNQGKAGGSNGTVKTLKDLSGFNNTGSLGTWFNLSGTASNWVKGKALYKEKFHTYDTVVRCDWYYSPSGRFRWVNSGAYTDTIPTYFDCDSVVHIQLTIKKSTTSAMNVQACWQYTGPSGNYTWNKSGTYKDYLKNAAGCDSTITIKLTIGGSRDTMDAVSCNSYMSPAGNIWTHSGFYSDTLTGYLGCDSIVFVNLSIDTTTYKHIYPMACRFYVSPKGRVYKTAGVYYDTFTGYKGCDSVLVIHLGMKHSYGIVNLSACDQLKSFGKKQMWTVSGVYQDTLINKAGCDSFLTVNLTVNKTVTGTDAIQVCDFYISPGRGRKWTETGIYYDTLISHSGCDSIVAVHLTVTKIEKTVSKSGNTLTADQIAGTYQWLDCNAGYSAVSGATSRQFTAQTDGRYACEVKSGTCTDTTVCIQVSGVGVKSVANTAEVIVFPNPGNGKFNIKSNSPQDWKMVYVFDAAGRRIYAEPAGSEALWQLRIQGISGLYVLRMEGPAGAVEIPLIVE